MRIVIDVLPSELPITVLITDQTGKVFDVSPPSPTMPAAARNVIPLPTSGEEEDEKGLNNPLLTETRS